MAVKRHRSAGAREIDGLDAVAALRHGRRVARLSQRDLARRAGVSQSLIARIETRRVDPPVGLMQRLLGYCGLRWDLRLTACGATPARAAAGAVAVRKSARQRTEAAGGRRMEENAAAREAAERLAGSWLTVRQHREEVRAARLAMRASQAAGYATLVASDDETMRGWLAADMLASERLLRRSLGQLAVPLADRLPVRLAGPEADDVRGLLEALSQWWTLPPVALTGSTARAVWSHVPVSRSAVDVDLAPLGDRGDAAAFLADAGALARPGGEMFDLRGLTLRLRPSPPPSTTLVRWRPGRPVRAIPVARPEYLPGVLIDRHAVRAVLVSAGRDSRGRRHPPYHEALGVAVRPWWFEPG